MDAEFRETRALLVASGALYDRSTWLADVLGFYVAVEIRTTIEHHATHAARMLSSIVHLLVTHEALLPCKLSVAGLTLVDNVIALGSNLSGEQGFARSGCRRHYDERAIFFGSGHRNQHASRLLFHLSNIIVISLIVG